MISGVSSAILTSIALELDRRWKKSMRGKDGVSQEDQQPENKQEKISSVAEGDSPVAKRARLSIKREEEKEKKTKEETLITAGENVASGKTEQELEEEKEDRQQLIDLLEKIEENTRDGIGKTKGDGKDKEKESGGVLGTIGTLIGSAIALAVSKRLGGGLMKIGAKLSSKFPKLGGALGKFGEETAEVGLKKAGGRALQGGVSKVAEKLGAKGIAASLKPAALVGGAAATGAAAAGISAAGGAASAAGGAAGGAGGIASVAGGASKGGGFFGKIGGMFGGLKDSIVGLKNALANPKAFLKANIKGIKTGLTKIPVLGTIIETIIGYFNISEILGNTEMSAKEKKEAIGKEIGARFGSLAGGVIGGALGSFVPGGTFIGGIAGALGGEWLGSTIAELIGPEGIYNVAAAIPGLGSLIEVPEDTQVQEPEVETAQKIPDVIPPTPQAPPVTPPTQTKPETSPVMSATSDNFSPVTTAALTAAVVGSSATPKAEVTPATPVTPKQGDLSSMSISAGSVSINAGSVSLSGATQAPSTTVDIPQLDTAVATDVKMKKEEKKEKKEEKKEEKKLGLTESIFGDSMLGQVASWVTPLGRMTKTIDLVYKSAANEGGILNTIGTGMFDAVKGVGSTINSARNSIRDTIFGESKTPEENAESAEGKEFYALIKPVSASGEQTVQGKTDTQTPYTLGSLSQDGSFASLLAGVMTNNNQQQSMASPVTLVNNTQSGGFPNFQASSASAGEESLDMINRSQLALQAV